MKYFVFSQQNGLSVIERDTDSTDEVQQEMEQSLNDHVCVFDANEALAIRSDINEAFGFGNKEKLMLDIQGEDPIEMCQFDSIQEDCEEDLSLKQIYSDVFQGHCSSCFSITYDAEAYTLADKYHDVDISDSLEPWEELAMLYIQHGYPVYLSDTCGFEVYPIGSYSNES